MKNLVFILFLICPFFSIAQENFKGNIKIENEKMILSLPLVENIGNFKLNSLESQFFLTQGKYLFNNLNFYSNSQSKELNFDLVASENATIKESSNYPPPNFSSIDKSWNIVLVDVDRCANYRNKLKSSE